ncbi:sigma-54 interaction domain-containing protein [Virgibacillus xinjiangensis]|uniref:HTH-type transcriptional regulatory protein TyrR n=1 Tax=Virgibacillus xinjiangensis TaxID=393090 RepID=A0ABV7CZ95_9BACI
MIETYSLETVPFPAFVLDATDKLLGYSGKLEEMLGQICTLGTPVTDLFSMWMKEENSKLIEAVHEERVFVFMESKLDKEGHRLLVGTETEELFLLRKQNKELRNLNRELDAVIENSYDGIYITDDKGMTWKTNSAIERITAIPKEYYIGKNVDELVERGILKNSVSKKALELKRTVSYVQKNYAGKETLLTGTPVFNEDGKIGKIVTNIRDLSDLNELQEKLSKLNQLNDRYKEELSQLKNQQQSKRFIAQSLAMRRIFETADRIANIDATVLILGETGVGKDVLANYIYEESTRSKEGEFRKVNCGAIPPELLESELFGYEAGAFTGASKKGKPGMFELADQGILFMDEVGELPLNLQVKLLRAIQEGEIQRIGGVQTKSVNVRVIAATNRNLKEMVEAGEFREDLYYRLNVIPVHIPPLRERKDDILPLIRLFLNQVNTRYRLNKKFDKGMKEFFLSYEWPGNIRELSNLIERLAVTADGDTIQMDHLPEEYHRQGGRRTKAEIMSLKEAAESAEREMIAIAVEKYSNTYEVAKALKTSQPTVVRKMKKYGINFYD